MSGAALSRTENSIITKIELNWASSDNGKEALIAFDDIKTAEFFTASIKIKSVHLSLSQSYLASIEGDLLNVTPVSAPPVGGVTSYRRRMSYWRSFAVATK